MLSLLQLYDAIDAVTCCPSQATGTPEVDIFENGDHFTTVGKMTLYKLPEVKVVTWVATKPVEELLDMLTEVKVRSHL